jgi:transposase
MYSRWVWVRFTTDMRQETLFRGLVDCFNALGFAPWVLVFDNMKTVTTGRDDQEQPIWHRALLQLAAEFDFHPVACWPDSGNQKGRRAESEGQRRMPGQVYETQFPGRSHVRRRR